MLGIIIRILVPLTLIYFGVKFVREVLGLSLIHI